MKRISLSFLLFLLNFKTFGQTKEQAGWLSLSGNYKISNHWGAYLDVQIRSSDQWNYLRQVIVRPGIAYHFNKNQIVTAGYAYAETYLHLDGIPDSIATENRLWEQFVQLHKIKRVFVTQRVRLEQRSFRVRGDANIFSQRFRYYTRFVLPFKKYDLTFKKGLYLSLQNEIYLNIQNKEKLNNSMLDQNRTYIGVGNRINTHIDVELGFLNQFSKGARRNTLNRVAQLTIATRF